MPGLGYTPPTTGRMGAKSTVFPSSPPRSSPSSTSLSSASMASPFAVCYVSSKPKGIPNNNSANTNPLAGVELHSKSKCNRSNCNGGGVIGSGYNSSNNKTSNNSAGINNNDEKPKLDPSDPRVKKLVYSMYRGMLTSCNGEANDIISKKDPKEVSQDSGVGPILESIIM